MKKLLIIALLFVGCVFRDYQGNTHNYVEAGKNALTITKIENDGDIYYISGVASWDKIAVKRKLSKELEKIREKNGYCCYEIIDAWNTSGWANKNHYQVRFSKTEEEFDKWNRRHKN